MAFHVPCVFVLPLTHLFSVIPLIPVWPKYFVSNTTKLVKHLSSPNFCIMNVFLLVELVLGEMERCDARGVSAAQTNSIPLAPSSDVLWQHQSAKVPHQHTHGETFLMCKMLHADVHQKRLEAQHSTVGCVRSADARIVERRGAH